MKNATCVERIQPTLESVIQFSDIQGIRNVCESEAVSENLDDVLTSYKVGTNRKQQMSLIYLALALMESDCWNEDLNVFSSLAAAVARVSGVLQKECENSPAYALTCGYKYANSWSVSDMHDGVQGVMRDFQSRNRIKEYGEDAVLFENLADADCNAWLESAERRLARIRHLCNKARSVAMLQAA